MTSKVKTDLGEWQPQIKRTSSYNPKINKIRIASDLHIGAPNQIGTSDDLFDFMEGENCFSLGDNFDMANVAKSEILELRYKCHTFLNSYYDSSIVGNHERSGIEDEVIFLNNDTILCHGDYVSWNPSKAIEYRSKPHGAGPFKRNILVPIIESAERFIDRTGDGVIKRASQFAKSLGMRTIIMGHLHPRDQIDVVHRGIRVVIVKRGFTEILLEERK